MLLDMSRNVVLITSDMYRSSVNMLIFMELSLDQLF